ncbi:septation protein SepH [Demequina flava]|uniref:septation protein SepH n=1 Tax=Demequina flava TaxID=1095025 RepID=UPI00078640B8|nr:septation protein SepH [Demequina flava]
MMRLTLVRPAEDGEHLIVADDNGTEYELVLTADLRRAANTVRPRPERDDAEASPTMSPREIQQRIRGGLNAAELAELTGQPIEVFQRYEQPVAAERSYIADIARSTRIGRDADSPVLGDLVTDRLAGRGVDPDAIVWDAWRAVDEPWMVAVDYPIDGRTVRAQWNFDHTARHLTALDDEARWLTETELLDVPIPKRHLSAVRDAKADAARPLEAVRPAVPQPETAAIPEVDEPQQTELLLDDLESRRGTRDAVEVGEFDDEDDDDDGGFEGFGPAVQRQRQAEVGFTATPSARSASATTGSTAPSAAEPPSAPSAAEGAHETEPKKPRRGRSSVPSWDEIVFGAKND